MSGNQPAGGPKGTSDGDKSKAGSDAAKTSAKPGGSAAPIEVKGSSKASPAAAESPSAAAAPKITPSGGAKPVAKPAAAVEDAPRVTKAASSGGAVAPAPARPTSSAKAGSSVEPVPTAKKAVPARQATAVGGAAATGSATAAAKASTTPESFPAAGETAKSAGGAFKVAAEPAAAAAAGAAKAPVGAPRKVKLTLSRINPLSAMKLSFFVALALGIATIVAVWILWHMLDSMHLFSDLDNFVNTTLGSDAGQPKKFDINDWVELGKVMTWTTMVAAANVVIMTILATLGTVVYNIISAVVGGLHVTLTDD